MKHLKKILAIALVGILSTSVFAACGGKESKYKTRPNKVVVVYAKNAFGSDWITNIANEYMEKYNTDTYIELKQTVIPAEEKTKIETGIASGDLYLLDMHLEDGVSYYESLTDVLDSTVIGETKTVREKYQTLSYDYFKNSGSSEYVMKYQKISTMGFVYNKTTLNELFGDDYTLPRTTDELFEFGNSVTSKGAYLIVPSWGDNSDYLKYLWKAWFAQLIGTEAYEHYMNGEYKQGDAWIFDENSPSVVVSQKGAIKDWYEIIKKLFTKSNGYVHDDALSIDASTAHSVHVGISFGKNAKKAVFNVNGNYSEKESGWMLESQASAGKTQELGMMKIPVASAITKRTPSINSDEVLRQVIDYVDGNATAAPEGVTEEDVAIVREARYTGASYMAGGMVIPVCASNKSGAKDFLRYLASDEAAVIAAKTMKGLSFLPFGKVATEDEVGFKFSTFVKDCLKIDETTDKVVSSDSQEYGFIYYGGFGFYNPNAGDYSKNVYNESYVKDAEGFYNEQYAYFEGKWSAIVRNYNNSKNS